MVHSIPEEEKRSWWEPLSDHSQNTIMYILRKLVNNAINHIIQYVKSTEILCTKVEAKRVKSKGKFMLEGKE